MSTAHCTRGCRDLKFFIPFSGMRAGMPCLLLGIWLLSGTGIPSQAATSRLAAYAPAVTYTNHEVQEVPWSIHVVRLELTNALFEILSMHTRRAALGLSPLSAQTSLVPPSLGTAVAAINGDFYVRNGSFAGYPRGMQIIDRELISTPNGGVTFWVDLLGEPHITNVVSLFQLTWPDGTETAYELNSELERNGLTLYTPALGRSTRASSGRQLVLERHGQTPWLPLGVGRIYQARVREVREGGDLRPEPGTLVLALGRTTSRSLPKIEAGAVLGISTATQPNLRAAKNAISGGPWLVRSGKRQRIRPVDSDSYVFSSMTERHPRSAIGWNKRYFYLVEVDGRQRGYSVGMTLEELSDYLVRLGCEEAMNFDGGGSSTLWFGGEVRNSPCDRHERSIANGLIIVRKNTRNSDPGTVTGAEGDPAR